MRISLEWIKEKLENEYYSCSFAYIKSCWSHKPTIFVKKCSKAFNSKILTRSGLKRSLQVYTLSSQLWWINQYSGQESQKKKKQKEMLKRKLDMKKIKIDIPFRLTLELPRTDC